MSTRKQPVLSDEIEQVLGPAPASVARPEVTVLRFRRHGRRLVLPVLVLIALAAASGYWIGALPEAWMNMTALAGAALAALLLGLLPTLSWLATRTTVTTNRVIMRTGLFVRHRGEVPLDRVREVRSRQGLWQRMWGVGSIDLLVGAESTTLRDVAGVQVVADALQELVQRNFAAAVGSGPTAPGFDSTGVPVLARPEGLSQ